MRRAFINRRVLILVGVLLCLGCITAGVFYYRTKAFNRRLRAMRTDGIAAAKAGDNAKAAENLATYLRRHPQDTEALWYMIHARRQAELPKLAHLAGTVPWLKSYLELCPDRIEEWHLLVSIYLRLDRRTETIDTANSVLAKWPGDVQALQAKAEAMVRLRQFKEALAVADAWVKSAPLDLNAYIQQLLLKRELNVPNETLISDALALLKAHPDDPRFETLLGVAYGQTGDTQKAARFLRQATTRKAIDDAFSRTLVTQLDALGLQDESLNVLKTLSTKGAASEVRFSLARRLWEMGRWSDVAAILNGVDPNDARADVTMLALGSLAYRNLKKDEDAQRYQRAVANRKSAVAVAWTTILRGASDDKPPDAKSQINECRGALVEDPFNPYLHCFLGDGNARMGEIDAAIQNWKRAATYSSAWAMPLVRMAEALLNKGQTQAAVAAAAEAIRRDQHSAPAAVVLVRALSGLEEGAGRSDTLEKLVDDIQRQIPGEENSLVVKVQLLARKAAKDEAIALARTAVMQKPALSAMSLLKLAAISEASGLGLEQQCLEACERAHGVTPELALAKAAREIATTPARVLASFDEMRAKATDKDEHRWQLALARLMDLAQDSGAKNAWIQLGDKYPQDVEVQRQALRARSVRGQRDFIQKTIVRLKELTGEEGITWRLAQARLQAASDSEDERTKAAVELHDILRISPDLIEAHLLLGGVLERMGKLLDAINEFRQVTNLDPDDVSVALHLAQLLQARGESDAARNELNRVAGKFRRPEEYRQAAVVLARQGEWEKAAQLLEKPETRGGEPRNDLLLAVIYQRRNELAKAETLVRKLLAEPDLATIQFAVDLFTSQGRLDEAEKAMALLEKQKLEPGVKEATWGRYYVTTGDTQQAIRQYELATKAAPTNAAIWRSRLAFVFTVGDSRQAIAVLDAAAAAVSGDAALDAIVSQRKALEAAAGIDGLRPVVVEFVANPVDNKAGVEALQAILAVIQSEDLSQMQAKLRQIVGRYPNYQPGHVLLIAHLAALGQVDDAVAAADKAAIAFPESAEPLRLEASILAARAQWRDVLAATQKWRDRSRGRTAVPDTLAAQAHIELQEPQEAIKLLKPYLSRATSRPAANTDLLTTYARAMCAGGDVQGAADLIWPLAEKDVAWRARFVALAAEMLDAQQGSQWINRATAATVEKEPEAMLVIAAAWQRLGKRLNDAALAQKSTELYATLTKPADTTLGVLLAAAGQREECDDLAGAEVLYRRALRVNAGHPVIQNNLAMVIAKRGGDLKEARELATSAMKTLAREPSMHDTLAYVQMKSGDYVSAIGSMRKAATLDPATAKWQIRLAQYLMDSGAAQEAAKAIESIDAAKFDPRGLSPELRTQLQTLRARVGGTKPG